MHVETKHDTSIFRGVQDKVPPHTYIPTHSFISKSLESSSAPLWESQTSPMQIISVPRTNYMELWDHQIHLQCSIIHTVLARSSIQNSLNNSLHHFLFWAPVVILIMTLTQNRRWTYIPYNTYCLLFFIHRHFKILLFLQQKLLIHEWQL
jgi:hypothetical protein